MLNIVNKTRDKTYRKYDSDLILLFNDVLKMFSLEDKEITIILTKDKYIRQLNKDYRGKDYATDVISFATIDDEDNEDDSYLGDIFINVEATKRQAIDLKHSFRREFNFLFMHGLLHCLGYDHIEEDDEKVMIAKQKDIIKNRGYLDEEI